LLCFPLHVPSAAVPFCDDTPSVSPHTWPNQAPAPAPHPARITHRSPSACVASSSSLLSSSHPIPYTPYSPLTPPQCPPSAPHSTPRSGRSRRSKRSVGVYHECHNPQSLESPYRSPAHARSNPALRAPSDPTPPPTLSRREVPCRSSIPPMCSPRSCGRSSSPRRGEKGAA
jgi:hypothetical protein